MKRERIDKLLVERGLVATRERARRMIMAGTVRVGENIVDKPGTLIPADAPLQVTEPAQPYVSRGGIKLEGALEHFRLSVRGEVVLDVGASTGGFTDCVLQRGAAAVYAVDVGYGQLDWSLRKDERVTVLERLNARYLQATELPGTPDCAVMDVSFISLRLVLPAVAECVAAGGWIVALVKPQFEVGKGQVGKGGVVRDERLHAESVDAVCRRAAEIGLELLGSCESPIRGPKGNREFFTAFRKLLR